MLQVDSATLAGRDSQMLTPLAVLGGAGHTLMCTQLGLGIAAGEPPAWLRAFEIEPDKTLGKGPCGLKRHEREKNEDVRLRNRKRGRSHFDRHRGRAIHSCHGRKSGL